MCSNTFISNLRTYKDIKTQFYLTSTVREEFIFLSKHSLSNNKFPYTKHYLTDKRGREKCKKETNEFLYHILECTTLNI